MRILLAHPGDDPETGLWAAQPWDRIVDIGLAGIDSYQRWQQRVQCSVSTLHSLRNVFEDFRRVRSLMDLGCGKLVDQHGLDWWEIMSILLHGELEALIILQRFAQTLGSADEVHVTRPGLHTSLLQCLVPDRVRVFPLRPASRDSGLAHYVRVCKKLSTSQIADVFWDKYDPGYQLRGRLSRKRVRSPRP